MKDNFKFTYYLTVFFTLTNLILTTFRMTVHGPVPTNAVYIADMTHARVKHIHTRGERARMCPYRSKAHKRAGVNAKTRGGESRTESLYPRFRVKDRVGVGHGQEIGAHRGIVYFRFLFRLSGS